MRTSLLVIGIIGLLSNLALAADPAWVAGQPGLFNQPESAFFDSNSKLIFVSSMGNSGRRDGFITALDSFGRVINARWATGLNNPKGLITHQNKLYVVEDDALVVFRNSTGAANPLPAQAPLLETRIRIQGAQLLNDVTVNIRGLVLVSDTFANRIYRIDASTPRVFAEGEQLQSPNGIYAREENLLVVGTDIRMPDGTNNFAKTPKRGHLMLLDRLGAKVFEFPEPTGGFDGIAGDRAGNILISEFGSGTVYRLSGRLEKLLTVPGTPNNIADISIAEVDRGATLLLVPVLTANKVMAFDYLGLQAPQR